MADKLIVVVDPQIAALVPRFLANRAADVGKMRTALACADFETIRAAAHAMKGAGGGYGFPEISRLGAALEAGAQQRDETAITGLVANLEQYLGRVEVAYPSEAGGASNG
jgi:HPt (histidine-containing phosphotransfer) domain-containing protein